MRRLIPIILAVLVAGCASHPLTPITNPISKNQLYEAELAFDATLKTFNKLKGLCANRTLPPACRTYVVKGQQIIPDIYAADKVARSFVKNNPTLDAFTVVSQVIGLVATFKGTVASLGATGG